MFTKTYTFKEFRNLELMKEVNKVENILNHIKKHKRLYRKLVLVVTMMLISGYVSPTLAYGTNVDEALTRLDELGNQLLKVVRAIGYWAVLLVTSKDCIAQAINGDKKGIGSAVTKGLMIMAVIYFLPELFSMMESIVSE